MRRSLEDILGYFGPLGRFTASGGTAFAALVPPAPGGLGSSPARYSDDNRMPNWYGAPRTVVTSLLYSATSTDVHTLTYLRPKNWARIKNAVAKTGTTFVLAADPGVYSTNYRYSSPIGTGTAALSDNPIATSDYVAYQLNDGTWQLDTVASGTFAALVVNTGVPNITGAQVLANSPMFFFGAVGDADPATGLADPTTVTANGSAATLRVQMADEQICGFLSGLHPGDPLILYSNNATTAGIIEGVSGFYARY